jgi:hypothetical protein
MHGIDVKENKNRKYKYRENRSKLLSQIIETNVEKIENKNYEWTENKVCG